MPVRRGPGLVVIVVLIVVGLALTNPWAFHIGGRWTPFLTWMGSGKLITKSGAEYPIFLTLAPSSHFSHLRLDGKRPTGGLSGSGCLCAQNGSDPYRRLRLSGTIYDGWWSAEGSLVEFRVLERSLINLKVQPPEGGYFDLYGKWNGQELVMDSRGSYAKPFLAGLKINGASVTLRWHVYWGCESACESAGRSRTGR